ncbi:ribosome modulation factor [Bowmanella denitrificans]|uniref:ribosome modulation factor n=1 Tax=Bowmanella denitrificans TaxID=366582 RepID=UPI000C9BE349|nr:ribosome modulation factor [Bowmanella denitrificans]
MSSNSRSTTIYYDKGYLAAERGQSLDSCRYKITHKRLDWMRGYRDAKDQMDFVQGKYTHRETCNQSQTQLKLAELRSLVKSQAPSD